MHRRAIFAGELPRASRVHWTRCFALPTRLAAPQMRPVSPAALDRVQVAIARAPERGPPFRNVHTRCWSCAVEGCCTAGAVTLISGAGGRSEDLSCIEIDYRALWDHRLCLQLERDVHR